MKRHPAPGVAAQPAAAHLILLAAGKGTRMMELTEKIPKTLIPILQDRCILGINVDNIVRSKAATKVSVVGGHAWPSLREHLDCYADCEIPVEGILNAEYDVVGPCRSIQLALPNAKDCDRIIIANGDTIFLADAFRCMKVKEPGFFLLGSRIRNPQPDDLVVTRAPGGRVQSASKANGESELAIVSSGMLAAVGDVAIEMLSDALTAVLEREKEFRRQLPWHDVLEYLSSNGAAAQLLLIDRNAWYEFDSRSCIARFHSQHDGAFLRA